MTFYRKPLRHSPASPGAGLTPEHPVRHGTNRTRFTNRLLRFARCVAIGLLTTPAIVFWILLFVEQYVPDITLQELMQIPFAREGTIAWVLGVAVAVAVVTDPTTDMPPRGHAERR